MRPSARTLRRPETRLREGVAPSRRPGAVDTRQVILILWDIGAVLAAFLLTAPLAGLDLAPRGAADRAGSDAISPLDLTALLFLATSLIGLMMIRDGDRTRGRLASVTVRLLIIAAVAVWVTMLGASAADWTIDLDQLILLSLVIPLAWLAGRLLFETRRRERVLLVGSGRVAVRVAALALRHPEGNLDVIGRLDDDNDPAFDDDPLLLGALSDLPRLLASGNVDRVVVCFSSAGDQEIARILRDCGAHRVPVDMVPRMFDLVGPAPRTHAVGGFPLVTLSTGCPQRCQGAAKRVFDVCVAAFVLFLTLPLLLVIALAVKIDSPGPVLYRSSRLGRQGRLFHMMKFRTMVTGADSAHSDHAADLLGGYLKRADDPRITRVGRFLRRLSLDELPQVLNVLAGTMSIVGPRPVLASEAEGTEGWASRRHDVRPGVTGLWQVLGRSTIPWDERMQLDYTYAQHWSLRFDAKILASTVGAVVSRRGAF